jgi:hypothetical protein
MSSRAQQPTSVIEVQAPATAPAPEPVLPGIIGGDEPTGTATPEDPGN